MNFIQFSDGKNDLEDISRKIGINIGQAKKIYKKLIKNKIIR